MFLKLNKKFSQILLSEKTKKILEKDKLYNCQNYAPLPVIISRAEGAYVYDVDGKKYLDCIGAISAVNQGHLHPRIKKAFIDQLNLVTVTSRAIHNNKLADACEYLSKKFGYEKAILMNTGVEGGETAIKFARRWGYQLKNIPKDQAYILFASENFWGRTLTACGSSDDPDRFRDFGPFSPNMKILEYNNADAFENELKANPNVAAIMLEPIQGEGGVTIPSNEFMTRIRQMCDKYKVLLILDEVQTGMGRTGKMLCQEHFGIKADLTILGKSLSGGFMPISAVVGRNEVFDLITPNSHGSTFGGNPLAAATLIEAIQVIEDEKMCDNSLKQGKYLLDALTSIVPEFPFLKNVRGKGLFLAFNICQKSGPKMNDFLYEMIEKGVAIKNTKENKVRLAPPLIITDKESKFIFETVYSTLKTLKKKI